MELEYTITENIHRTRSGQIMQIDFQFEETIVVSASTSGSSTAITRHNKEKRNRTYDTTVTRDQYQKLASRFKNPLPFDDFVNVLRPFIMGFYQANELERAFNTLDRDHSGSIDISELASFLPLLNDEVDRTALMDYARKVDNNFDGNMTYQEFRTLVLRGIGRDIICNKL